MAVSRSLSAADASQLLAQQPFARQLQEHLAVALQAFAGEIAEHPLHLLARAGESELTLGAHAFLGFDPHPQQLQLDAQRLLAFRAPQQRRKHPERAPEDASRRRRQPHAGAAHARPLRSSQPSRSSGCATKPSPPHACQSSPGCR